MINQDLLEILACPEDKTPVSMADQALVDEITRLDSDVLYLDSRHQLWGMYCGYHREVFERVA